MTRQEAYDLRSKIEFASSKLSDDDALQVTVLFPKWSAEVQYECGDRIRFDGTLYKCITMHQSQIGWEPLNAPSLWAKVLIPDPDVIVEWEQPDSTNAYSIGDKVSHNGFNWISEYNYNVWEPGVYGWSKL